MQSKRGSLIEQVCNVGSGFFVAFLVWQCIAAPLYGIDLSLRNNLGITLIFTVVSILRGYVWRRVFNYFIVRKHHGRS